jgi:hypothetical protein
MCYAFLVVFLFAPLEIKGAVVAAPDFVHSGSPLEPELIKEQHLVINISKSDFPATPKEITTSEDGHAFKEVNIPGNHHTSTTLYVHSPGGPDSKIDIRYLWGRPLPLDFRKSVISARVVGPTLGSRLHLQRR